MGRSKRATLEARVKQYNDLVAFHEKHENDYYIQVNLAAPGSSDHICIPIPHEHAEAVIDYVHSFLVGEVTK